MRTTDSAHSHPVAPNTLDRKFEPDTPNSTWAGDITYVWTAEGWLHLLHEEFREEGYKIRNLAEREENQQAPTATASSKAASLATRLPRTMWWATSLTTLAPEVP